MGSKTPVPIDGFGIFWLIVTDKPYFNRMPVLDTESPEVGFFLGEFFFQVE